MSLFSELAEATKKDSESKHPRLVAGSESVDKDIIKLNVHHYEKERASKIDGSLLITPNTLIFDPDHSDPMIELEPELYQVVTLTKYIIRVTLDEKDAKNESKESKKRFTMTMETRNVLSDDEKMYVMSYGRQKLEDDYIFYLEDYQAQALVNFLEKSHQGILLINKISDRIDVPDSTPWQPLLEQEELKELLSDIGNVIMTPMSNELSEASNILSNEDSVWLAQYLPRRILANQWFLAFSTAKDGYSLKSFYRTAYKVDGPFLLVVQDTDGVTFGALLSEPPKVCENFLGTGECWLFSFKNGRQLYPWSGENFFFIQGSESGLVIGSSQGRFGIWLDQDLNRGRSESVDTFHNESLTLKQDFQVKSLEAWSFL